MWQLIYCVVSEGICSNPWVPGKENEKAVRGHLMGLTHWPGLWELAEETECREADSLGVNILTRRWPQPGRSTVSNSFTFYALDEPVNLSMPWSLCPQHEGGTRSQDDCGLKMK